MEAFMHQLTTAIVSFFGSNMFFISLLEMPSDDLELCDLENPSPKVLNWLISSGTWKVEVSFEASLGFISCITILLKQYDSSRIEWRLRDRSVTRSIVMRIQWEQAFKIPFRDAKRRISSPVMIESGSMTLAQANRLV